MYAEHRFVLIARNVWFAYMYAQKCFVAIRMRVIHAYLYGEYLKSIETMCNYSHAPKEALTDSGF